MTVRTPLALIATLALALGAAACGSAGADEPASSAPPPKGKYLARVENISGRATTLALDSGFLAALKSLGVSAAPVGRARVSVAGIATFPITGGNVTYYRPGTISPYVQGVVNHDGSGLSLSAGGKVVELRNFDVDPGRSVLTGDVDVDGKQAVRDTPLFFLDGRTLKPLQTSGNLAILEGTTVKLKAEAATLLNRTFGITALQGGLVIGIATIAIAR